MQKHSKMKKGDSIDNAIIIDAPNSILGVIAEHQHIDRICGTKDNDVQSVEQNLIKENQKIYDMFAIKMDDGTERILYFEITSFFGKI